MPSTKQIAANQANASRSTGPKTLTGKRKASMNAVKHGLTCSRDVVIWDEDPREFERLRAELEKVYPPRNALVRELVGDLAGQLWRIRRAPKLEAAALDSSIEDSLIYLLQLAHPDKRKRVLERFNELRQNREQTGEHELDTIHFAADLTQAWNQEVPEVMEDVLEAEKARDTGWTLAVIARHEAGLRNGIARTLAMLHALGAGPVDATQS